MAQDPLIIINIDPAGDPVHNHEHIIRGLGILRAMEYIPGIDSPKKRDRETLEHIAVTRYLECLIHHGYIIAYSTIPNSTYTPFRSVKAKGKMMGVSKGFPDIASILYVEQETDLIKTALAIAQGGAMAKVAGVSFTDFNTTIAAISSAFSS